MLLKVPSLRRAFSYFIAHFNTCGFFHDVTHVSITWQKILENLNVKKKILELDLLSIIVNYVYEAFIYNINNNTIILTKFCTL